MLVKSQVKYIQSLGHKKFRDADQVFVAEGPKIVEELLMSAPESLVQCFATAKWMSAHAGTWRGQEKLLTEIGESELERISFHSKPNQVLGIFKKPAFHQTQPRKGLTILLESIQDPGNLGTIIRTADWFGVHHIVCSEGTADIFSPKVVQSAMGSVVRTAVSYQNLEVFIRENADIPVYAASLEGADLSGNLQVSEALLLLGNESKGISPELEALAFKKIRIPGKGSAESLNVAVAAGILLSRLEIIS